MAQCAQCMFENEEGAVSCEQCGADISVEVLSLQLGEVCRSCDSYNEPGVRVCVSCGQALVEGDVVPVAEPQTEPDGRPISIPALQPWMAPPDTGKYATPGGAPAPAAAAAAPAVPAPAAKPAPQPAPAPAPAAAPPRGVSSLPPGALPPGWAAGGAKAPAAAARAAAEAGSPCPRCHAPNLANARFCGSCGAPLSAAPVAAKARGKLILIRGLAGEGRQFSLTGAANTAGRDSGAFTFPEDPYVAPLHATFLFRGEDLLVRDEGTGNGLYVRLREPQALRPGDLFVVGERLLRYTGPGSVPPAAGRHGSPRIADRLQVIEEILEGGGIGRVCKRPGPIISIGRAGCDLNFPSDGFVSARHAEISLAGETAFLRDLGSANGTYLRMQPRAERTLQHGDYVLMGRELLRIELTASR